MTRGTGGRDPFRWVNYRANVYSIRDDTPKKAENPWKTGAGGVVRGRRGAGLAGVWRGRLKGGAGAVCARPRASIGTNQI